VAFAKFSGLLRYVDGDYNAVASACGLEAGTGPSRRPPSAMNADHFMPITHARESQAHIRRFVRERGAK
jgi:hypothetical protein